LHKRIVVELIWGVKQRILSQIRGKNED
jgi:hypothetical protein